MSTDGIQRVVGPDKLVGL